jgi:hypothetical protein
MTDTKWIIGKDHISKGRKKTFNGWIATLVGKNDERLDIIRSWTKKSLIEEINFRYPYQEVK